jgi:hypothetical protein
MEASLMSIAMKSGISFETWKRGVDAVIPKKTSSPRVDKLRTIVLHAADANICYKHIAKKIVHVAEKIPGALAPEQYARKGRSCGSQVLNKRITFDIWRQKRTPGIITPNNLHSNYDRICHSIAALAARRLGIQESEVNFMTSTLQDMKHTICRAFGDSTDSYGGEAWTMPLPPQGIYQGNGIGPTAWLIISSNLLDIMRQLGYGAFCKTALSGDTLDMAGFLYVDDTDLTQSQTPTMTTTEEVLEKIQEGLDTWEGLIKASGGALSNDKSCWWYVDFSFDHKGDWRYKKMEELEGELTAINIGGTRKALKRLEVMNPSKLSEFNSTQLVMTLQSSTRCNNGQRTGHNNSRKHTEGP